jgi:acetyltransferase
LRVARPRDRAALGEFLARLSPATLQARYMTMLTRLEGPLAERELRRVLVRDVARHVVVVAEERTAIRGVAEFVMESNGRDAELAFTVEDGFQHRGIGRRLYRRLEVLARRRGVVTFTGDMRHGNYAMQQFLRATGRPLHLESTFGGVRFRLQIA